MNSDTEVMYEPIALPERKFSFNVAEQPANPALNILDPETPPIDSDLAFDPENPAEWQPAVAAHAEEFVRGTQSAVLVQMGDFSAAAQEFLLILQQSKERPTLLDSTMRAMTRIDQIQLLPVLQAELQKAARTVTPGLNLHTSISIPSV